MLRALSEAAGWLWQSAFMPYLKMATPRDLRPMKNIQVIDCALNCTFSIFQATDEEFALFFQRSGRKSNSPKTSPICLRKAKCSPR